MFTFGMFKPSTGGGGSSFPAFVAAGTLVGSSGSVSVPYPSGWAADDIGVLIHSCDADDVFGSDPAGWTSLITDKFGTNLNGIYTRLYWRRLQSGDSSPTISDAGSANVGIIIAIRGCKSTGSPFDGSVSSAVAASTSVSIPDVTTTQPNCLIVDISTLGDSTAIGSTPLFSGWANGSLSAFGEVVNVLNNSVSRPRAFGIATGQLGAAGSAGTTTATSSFSRPQVNFKLAFTPT